MMPTGAKFPNDPVFAAIRHYRRVYGRGDLGHPAEALVTALETVRPHLTGAEGREAPARPR